MKWFINSPTVYSGIQVAHLTSKNKHPSKNPARLNSILCVSNTSFSDKEDIVVHYAAFKWDTRLSTQCDSCVHKDLTTAGNNTTLLILNPLQMQRNVFAGMQCDVTQQESNVWELTFQVDSFVTWMSYICCDHCYRGQNDCHCACPPEWTSYVINGQVDI